MAIRLPIRQQTLRPVSGATPQVPEGGQGERAIAQGLGALGQGVEQIRKNELDLQKKRNLRELLELESKFEDAIRKQDVELRQQRRGTAAEGVTNDADTWYANTVEDIVGSASNEVVQQLFTESSIKRRDGFLDSIALFEAKEGDAALVTAAESAVENNVQLAGRLADNPSAIKDIRAQNIEYVNALAETLHWSDSQTQLTLETKLSQMHRQVFDSLVDTNPAAAKAHFEQYKDEIQDHSYYTDTLLKADRTIEAQTEFDALLDEHGDDYLAMREAASEKLEGWVQDDVVRRIANEEQAQKRAETALSNEVTNTAYQQFVAGGVRTDAIDRAVWRQLGELNAPAQLSLLQQEKNFRDGVDKTNSEAFMYLWTLASNPETQDLFMDINIPVEYGHELSVGDRNYLFHMRENIEAGRNSSVRTSSQIISDGMLGLEDDDARAEFVRQVNDAAAAERDTTGQPVSDKRLEEIVNQQRSNITWTTDRSRFIPGVTERSEPFQSILADPEQFFTENPAARINATQQADLEAALREARIPVTEENILFYHLKNLGFVED